MDYRYSDTEKAAQAVITAQEAAKEAQRRRDALTIADFGNGTGLFVGGLRVDTCYKDGDILYKTWRNLYTNPNMESLGGDVTLHTNYAANPGFERSDSQHDLFTNMFANPSAETASGTAEVRRNIIPNPRVASDAMWGGYGGGQAPYTNPIGFEYSYQNVAVAHPLGITRAMQQSFTADGIGGSTYIEGGARPSSGTDHTIAPSTLYTGSIYVLSSKAITVKMRFRGNGTGGDRLSSDFAIPANTWTRVWLTVTTTADETTGNFVIKGSSTTMNTGDWIQYTGALMEKVSALLPYFDGSYSQDSDLTATWTGTANASQCTLVGVGVAHMWDVAYNMHSGSSAGQYCTPYQTSKWAKSGSKSVALLCVSDSTAANVSVLRTDFRYNGWTLPAGTYTLAATLCIPSAISSVNTNSGTIMVEVVGVGTRAISAQTVAAGVYRHVVTFTIASGEVPIFHFRGGAVTGEVVYIDDAMLVAGSYDPGDFNGATPPRIRENLSPGVAASITTTTSQGASIDNTYQYDGHTWSRFVQGSSGTNAILRNYIPSANRNRLALGHNYTASALVHNPGASDISVSIDWCDQAIKAFTIPAGQTVRVSTTGKRTDGYSDVYRFLDLYVNEVGAEFLAREFMIERSDTLGEFFDGSTSPDPNCLPAWEVGVGASVSYLYDRDYRAVAWLGTAHASQSVIKADTPYGGGISATDSARKVIRSSRWSSNGGYSARVMAIPRANNDSFVAIDLPDLLGSSNASKLAGKLVTIQATVRWEKARNKIYSFPTFRFGYDAASGTSPSPEDNSVWLDTPSDAPGSYRKRATFVFPSDMTALNFARVTTQNGTAGDADVYVDDVVFVIGDYTGDYFDGSISPDADMTAAWTGEANKSTSTLKAPAVSWVAVSYSSPYTAPPRFYRHINEDGTSAARLRFYPHGSGSWAYGNLGHTTILNNAGLKAGNKLTFAVRARAKTLDGNVTLPSFSLRLATGSASSITGYANFYPTEDYQWFKAVVTVNSPPNGSHLIYLSQSGVTGKDCYIDIDQLMVMPGDYTGEYWDGDKPPTLRRNLYPNNYTEDIDSGGGSATSGSSPETYGRALSSERSRYGNMSQKMWGLDSADQGGSWYIVGRSVSMEPGTKFAMSAWIYTESGKVPDMVFCWNDYTSIGTAQLLEGTKAVGGWFRVGITGTVPSGKTGVRFYTNLSGLASVYYIDAVLVERDTQVHGKYFDGDHYKAYWEGTPGLSPSVRYDARYTIPSWEGDPHESVSRMWGANVDRGEPDIVPFTTPESAISALVNSDGTAFVSGPGVVSNRDGTITLDDNYVTVLPDGGIEF